MRFAFRTVAGPLRHAADPIKGSRFVAEVHPVESAEAALAVLGTVRAAAPDASHHCFAWRLDAEGRQTRTDDDGEPTHSAGAPILRAIEGRELAGLLVVVSRWFGGTKLGVGGLIRAYGGAAGEALDRAEIVERPVLARVRLRFAYPQSAAVETLGARHGARTVAADYGAEVSLELVLPLEGRAQFVHDLGEATSGRVWIDPVE